MNRQTKMIVGAVLIVAGFITSGPLSYLMCFIGGGIFSYGYFSKEEV